MSETWVKLYLVPQTEGAPMPENIVGVLEQETATAYVLTHVLEQNDDFELEPTEGMSFINRTYVWRCEILTYDPVKAREEENEDFFDQGGLG